MSGRWTSVAARGAVTFHLAEATGPQGSVDAVDLSPEMVRLTKEEARRTDLGNVHVAVTDVTEPDLLEGSYDILASSLVLFFLPEPETA